MQGGICKDHLGGCKDHAQKGRSGFWRLMKKNNSWFHWPWLVLGLSRWGNLSLGLDLSKMDHSISPLQPGEGKTLGLPFKSYIHSPGTFPPSQHPQEGVGYRIADQINILFLSFISLTRYCVWRFRKGLLIDTLNNRWWTRQTFTSKPLMFGKPKGTIQTHAVERLSSSPIGLPDLIPPSANVLKFKTAILSTCPWDLLPSHVI